jgi:hypothetical protein
MSPPSLKISVFILEHKNISISSTSFQPEKISLGSS